MPIASKNINTPNKSIDRYDLSFLDAFSDPVPANTESAAPVSNLKLLEL